MAFLSKKDKFLDSAQKFILKGQIDKAIKDYEQAVALDPKDIRVRQKFAELLVRAGRKEEAFREYEVIGKYYADNGFNLKAIAVYKQIQKLDPANLAISLALAALNEKQGLVGNALAEYKAVFDQYEKSGALIEAINVLEKMLAVDKENLNIKLKIAETRFNAGLVEQSYGVFTELAMELRNRGDDAAFGRVSERIRSLFPERTDFLLNIAETQLRAGNPTASISILRQLAGDDNCAPDALYLLAEAGRAAGNILLTKQAYGKLVQRFPDEISAKKALVACVIEQGEIEEGFTCLRRFEADLLPEEFDALEGFYRALGDIVPHDARVAEGIARIYTTMGLPLPVQEVEQVSALPIDQEDAVNDLPDESFVGQITDSPSSEPISTNDESSWEEEIDISFDEDEGFSGNGFASEVEELGSQLEETCIGDDLPSAENKLVLEGSEPAFPFEGTEGFPGESSAFGLEIEDTSVFPSPCKSEEIEFEITDSGISTDDWFNELEDQIDILSEDTAEKTAEMIEAELPVLAGVGEHPTPLAKDMKRDKYALDGLFSAFKKGVDQQLEQGDTETHYNLGIAYKEMGLLDDAIAEFKVASLDPHRFVDCITLQGICLRDKGDLKAAETILKSGLAHDKLSEEEYLCLKYEIALLHEAAGEEELALAEYREIFGVNPHFRDTVQKIARLQCEDEAIDLADIELVDLEDAD